MAKCGRMSELAYVLTFITAYTLGFYFKELWNKVKALESNIEAKKSNQDEFEENISTLFDEEDVVQRARFEQQEIERKLNPEKYE